MKCAIPQQLFYQLSAPQMSVANALAHRARAAHWLVRAREGSKELRSMHVSFARAAHRAYLKDLHRAIRLNELLEARR